METHPDAVRLRARDLVVAGKTSLAEVARLTGVPEGTLKRWSASEGWQDQRNAGVKYAELMTGIKLKAAEKASADPSPDNLAALCQLERTYPERHYAPEMHLREMALRVFDPFATFLASRAPGDVCATVGVIFSEWVEEL